MTDQKTGILAVKLVPGPNRAPMGRVFRVYDINEAIEKNIHASFRNVTSRSIDVAFDLPVIAVFGLHSDDRFMDVANVAFHGPVLLFGKDEDGRTCSLSRAQIHAIAYFCASFRYSEE